MKNKKVSINKIKAIVSTVSMALLFIQHMVGLLADTAQITYIPLLITFVTIFISSWDVTGERWIYRVSLAGAILMLVLGFIEYTLFTDGIEVADDIRKIYIQIVYCGISIISLTLSKLYTKRIHEVE